MIPLSDISVPSQEGYREKQNSGKKTGVIYGRETLWNIKHGFCLFNPQPLWYGTALPIFDKIIIRSRDPGHNSPPQGADKEKGSMLVKAETRNAPEYKAEHQEERHKKPVSFIED